MPFPGEHDLGKVHLFIIAWRWASILSSARCNLLLFAVILYGSMRLRVLGQSVLIELRDYGRLRQPRYAAAAACLQCLPIVATFVKGSRRHQHRYPACVLRARASQTAIQSYISGNPRKEVAYSAFSVSGSRNCMTGISGKACWQGSRKIGGPCRDRTYDQEIKSLLLYQLS